jgi:membrane-associated phospholipid phosphatase
MGLAIIQAIQSLHGPFLDQFFRIVSELHGELVYLVVLPLLVWLYDKKFARFMGHVFILGNVSNEILKDLFNTGRPSPADVRSLHAETSGAFPSGHSQNPLLFWGAVTLQVRRRWVTVALTSMVVLIGISRLYLGAHWPLDVIGGWAIGACMLWVMVSTRSVWTGEKQDLRTRMFWAVLFPSAVLAGAALLGVMPALMAPTEAKQEFYKFAGVYYGFLIGSALEEEYVGFNPRLGGILAQTAKVVVGLALVLAVKEGFKLFLPASNLGDMIRYGSMGLMVTAGAPLVFRRFTAAPPAGRNVA